MLLHDELLTLEKIPMKKILTLLFFAVSGTLYAQEIHDPFAACDPVIACDPADPLFETEACAPADACSPANPYVPYQGNVMIPADPFAKTMYTYTISGSYTPVQAYAVPTFAVPTVAPARPPMIPRRYQTAPYVHRVETYRRW